MEIQHSTKLITVIIAALFCMPVFADEANWQQQNANLEAEQANIAKEKADTAAENANTLIELSTPVPTPKETVVVPQGYLNCFMIKAGWFNGSWIQDHRVCQYSGSKEGIAWIDGYWACTKYKSTGNLSGECTSWQWKSGHWVQKFDLY